MIMRWEEQDLQHYFQFIWQIFLSPFLFCEMFTNFTLLRLKQLINEPMGELWRTLQPPHLESQAELSEGASDLLCEEVHALTLLQRHHLVRSPLLRLPQQFGHVELFWELLHDLLQHRSHLVINWTNKQVCRCVIDWAGSRIYCLIHSTVTV